MLGSAVSAGFSLCSNKFPTCKVIKPHVFNTRLENNTTIFQIVIKRFGYYKFYLHLVTTMELTN